jgi:2-polyprenyl-6-methoxyphenol hydroxylase-like FAD-dependent oxidoreductase
MIAIAGAGIGGLTLGCALARRGRPFCIFEHASELRPAGAGIALSANAFHALAHVGLEERVRACGLELGVADIRDPQGNVLLSVRLQDLPGGGTVAMTRASLQQALLDVLGTSIQTGCAVVGYQPEPGGVRVHLANGETIEAELLVGADGLHSTVRRAMRGEEALRYSGQTSWRALVNHAELADSRRFSESWGPRRRFGIVPVGAGRVYWFAVANAPAGERGVTDPRPDLEKGFTGWHAPIGDLIAATPPDSILRTDIFDRPPIDRWVDGRAVLLGDAAHPMTPNKGMGGCQAIEDAVVLADALQRETSIDAALTRYQKQRIVRANRFVVRSFRVGQLAHLGAPPLRWLRDRALSVIPRRLVASAVAKDFDFQL